MTIFTAPNASITHVGMNSLFSVSTFSTSPVSFFFTPAGYLVFMKFLTKVSNLFSPARIASLMRLTKLIM